MMAWFKKNKKPVFVVTESTGLADYEREKIEGCKGFDEFVVTMESLNQLLLRDEREADVTIFFKIGEKEIFGKTLELPQPLSTDFYQLLDKFNSKKPHAPEIHLLASAEVLTDGKNETATEQTSELRAEESEPETKEVSESVKNSLVSELGVEPPKTENDPEQLLSENKRLKALLAAQQQSKTDSTSDEVDFSKAETSQTLPPKTDVETLGREDDSEDVSEVVQVSLVETSPHVDPVVTSSIPSTPPSDGLVSEMLPLLGNGNPNVTKAILEQLGLQDSKEIYRQVRENFAAVQSQEMEQAKLEIAAQKEAGVTQAKKEFEEKENQLQMEAQLALSSKESELKEKYEGLAFEEYNKRLETQKARAKDYSNKLLGTLLSSMGLDRI